jgi:hypothetical protein
MTAHKHAQNMLIYANDAYKTDRPWDLWECKSLESDKFTRMTMHPGWRDNFEYRHKIKTININGFEVPEPLREEPIKNSIYWVIGTDESYSCNWRDLDFEKDRLKNGICHLTKEAAEIHRNALLSFTKIKE